METILLALEQEIVKQGKDTSILYLLERHPYLGHVNVNRIQSRIQSKYQNSGSGQVSVLRGDYRNIDAGALRDSEIAALRAEIEALQQPLSPLKRTSKDFHLKSHDNGNAVNPVAEKMFQESGLSLAEIESLREVLLGNTV